MKNFILFTLLSIIFWSCKGSNNVEKSNDMSDMAIKSTADGEIIMRFAPKIGTKTKAEFKTIVKSKDASMDLNVEHAVNINTRIVSFDDSIFVCHLDFQRYRMYRNLNGKEISYDSQNDENTVLEESNDDIHKLLANKAISHIDTLGHVTSMQMNGESIKTDAFSSHIQLIPFTEKKLKVGDSWLGKPLDNRLSTKKLKYTIVDISNDEVVVSLVSEMDDSNSNYPIEGTYVIDRKTGYVSSANLTMQDYIENLEIVITVESTIE